MDHASIRELAAGAALDDLDADERQELDRHLAACRSCRRLAGDLDDVVGELALVAPVRKPPTALRASVLDALREPPRPALHLVADATPPDGTKIQAAPVTTIVPARASRIPVWAGIAAAAVFAVIAVGLGAQNQRLGGEVAAANEALAVAQSQLQARQAAVAVAADPQHVTVAMHAEPMASAANAVVMFRPGTADAYLMATDLPATPEGQVYQLWYADGSGVHPLGTYSFDGEGAFVAPFGVDLTSSAAAMVTLEPVGGAVGEPGPQVVFGEF